MKQSQSFDVCPISGESHIEERINHLTHLGGLILSVIGSAALFIYVYLYGNMQSMAICGAYGFTLILLYTASTFYHGCKTLHYKAILRIADHASIYLLIAGCYTPFALGPLKDGTGWTMFWIEWGIACIGVIFKLFATHRFQLLSTLAYLGMGWLVVFSLPALIETLPFTVNALLISGGLSYSLGTFFFLRESLPFNHGIWHVFVLGGGICHYCAIFIMVIYNPDLWF
ncbi:MAG: hemolysin III family protein [Parachlamydiaceae bacterium]